MFEYDFNATETVNEVPIPEVPSPEQLSFDEGFDFERLASEWFRDVDTRRESSSADNHIDEDNSNDLTEDEARDITDNKMEEWLR